MNLRHLFLTCLLIAAACAPRPSVATVDRHNAATIQAVADQFQAALRDKNRDAFLNLLLHPDITWQSVSSDVRQTQDRLRRPGQPPRPKAFVDRANNATQFIDGIVGSPERIEEIFGPLAIDSDGEAASVAFDFDFLRDKRLINRGREYWHLVRTEQGWKITAVTWSKQALPAPTKEQ